MTNPPERINPEIGQRLRQIREAAGLSQERLALLAGCPFTVINRLERGHQTVSAERLAHFAKLLCVSPDFLLYGERSAEEEAHTLRLLQYSTERVRHLFKDFYRYQLELLTPRNIAGLSEAAKAQLYDSWAAEAHNPLADDDMRQLLHQLMDRTCPERLLRHEPDEREATEPIEGLREDTP
jgi:transcriptional regulator with XRE-family HTH domain